MIRTANTHRLFLSVTALTVLTAIGSANAGEKGYVLYKRKNIENSYNLVAKIKDVSNLKGLTYVITLTNDYQITNNYTKPDVAKEENAALKNGASMDITNCGVATFPPGDSIREYLDFSVCEAGRKTPPINTADLKQSLGDDSRVVDLTRYGVIKNKGFPPH